MDVLRLLRVDSQQVIEYLATPPYDSTVGQLMAVLAERVSVYGGAWFPFLFGAVTYTAKEAGWNHMGVLCAVHRYSRGISNQVQDATACLSLMVENIHSIAPFQPVFATLMYEIIRKLKRVSPTHFIVAAATLIRDLHVIGCPRLINKIYADCPNPVRHLNVNLVAYGYIWPSIAVHSPPCTARLLAWYTELHATEGSSGGEPSRATMDRHIQINLRWHYDQNFSVPLIVDMKLHCTLGGLLSYAYCTLAPDTLALGPVDQFILQSVRPNDYDKLDNHRQGKILSTCPNVFMGLPIWRCLTPSGREIPLTEYLFHFYRSCAPLSVDIHPQAHQLLLGSELVEWPQDTVSQPSQFELARLSLTKDTIALRWIRAILCEIAMGDPARVVPRTGIFNLFINRVPELVGYELRFLSAIVQSAPVSVVFWVLGIFSSRDVPTPIYSSQKYPVHTPSGLIAVWTVIQSFGRDSSLKDYRPPADRGDFITYLVDLLTQEVYLYGPMGWICAYLLLLRLNFPSFGLSLPVTPDSIQHMVCCGNAFRKGFNLILDWDTVSDLLTLEEIAGVLTKEKYN
jgi:hypothetical protein